MPDSSSKLERGVNRRELLRRGVIAAAGAALLGRPAPAQEKPATAPAAPGGLPERVLGKTGRKLPILALGGSAMVQRFFASYGVALLSMDERIAIVRDAFDRGVRYFDTARIYGESEEIYGKALKSVRDQVYIATKVHATAPGSVRQSVETSLQQLGTTWLDCVQIHSPAIEMIGPRESMKLHAELVKLRDEGLLKYIGLTTHVAFEAVHEMIATGGFDQVLLACGYFRKGMDTLLSNRNLELREKCIARAHELKMGIVAMKVLGANIFSHNAPKLVPGFDAAKLEKLPGAAIRWVLADERISLLNIGASKADDVARNVAILRGRLELTDEDRALLAAFSADAYAAEAIARMRVV
jgi:aryl-alcohol dehydrogenase-like predicted oxidoreductase